MTQFQGNFYMPPAETQTITEVVNTAAATVDDSAFYGGGSLTFPSTLTTEWRHIMHFQRYEYSRADAKSTPTESRSGSLISLPIPQNLQATYSADWSNESLGLLGNQVMQGGNAVLNSMKNNGGGMAGLKDTLTDFAGGGSLGEKAKSVLMAAGIDGLKDTGAGRALSKITGMAVNPFNAVLYGSPDFRSFDFTYKFIPRNLSEANTLRGMHPTLDAAFEDNIFKFPDVWRLTIPNDEYLFKFTTCILKNASFDFHAEGTKSYFKGEANIPVSVMVTLSFQEIAILTKEDIESGY